MDAFEASKVIPFFTSSSIVASAEFYEKILKFRVSINPPPPGKPTMASICCGDKAAVNIYIFEQPDMARGRCMVMLSKLGDVHALHKHLFDNGAEESTGNSSSGWTGYGREKSNPSIGIVTDEAWGYRQFDMEDRDGNLICFFAFL